MITRRLPLSLALLCIAALGLSVGCAKDESSSSKTGGAGKAPLTGQQRLDDQEAMLGVPVTADGAVDRDALKRLAYIAALQHYPWNGADFAWGDVLAADPAWESTPHFDQALPLREAQVQPPHYLLPDPDAAHVDSHDHEEPQSGKSKSGEKFDAAAREKEALKAAASVRAPFDPASWAAVPYEAGLFPVTFQQFAYQSDSLNITGFGAIPTAAAPAPVLILVHGLIPVERYSNDVLAREARYFASHGFLVLVPDQRNYGRSAQVEEAPELIRLGQLRDVANLVAALRITQLPNISRNEIALWGFGHGGSVAMKVALLMHPTAVCVTSPTGLQESLDRDLFAAGMAPAIAASMDRIYGESNTPATLSWYHDMSYSNFFRELACPLAIVSGKLDPLVPIDRVRQIVSLAAPNGLQISMSEFPTAGHELYGADWIGMVQSIEQFLIRLVTLPPAPDSPAIP